MRGVFLLTLAAAAACAVPASISAQVANQADRNGLYASRSALEDLLRQFELAAASPAYSEGTRAEARTDAERIRQRLEQGDFQTGDQIHLIVEGESTLTDTFTVATGPSLVLPTVGSLALRGVLRAELREYLRSELARFIRDPVVRARTLIRVSIVGEVERPGFYMVPTEGLVTDVITVAGGPTRDAQLDAIIIERGAEVMWDPEPLSRAIIEGRTLDQLNLQAGDRIDVPRRSRGLAGLEGTARTIGFLLSIPLSIFAISQVF